MDLAGIADRKETYAYLQHRRFPYFKVQWYDPVSLCWRDVQKAHSTTQDAESCYLPGKQCRTMQVNANGRHPV